MSDLHLGLALEGNLQSWGEGLVDAMIGAISVSVADEAKRVERALEDETSILGGLARAWEYELFPKSGRSYSPSADVVHTEPHIIEAHSNGADIQAKRGRYLWIPIEGSPADRRYEKHQIPRLEMQSLFGRDQIKLIVTKKGQLLVVAQGKAMDPGMAMGKSLRKEFKRRRGFGKAGNVTRTYNQHSSFTSYIEPDVTIPLFILKPNVRLEKIMDWRGRAEMEARSFPDRVDSNLQARFDAYARNPDGIEHMRREYPL
jgi:hypothetical protein